MFSKVASLLRKEIASYFVSPIAFIFLAIFLVITLFTFFWVEAFFARNIADVRPLFSWMPILLIFLVGALTMRMWSEERRMGTLEFLLTLPVSTFQLVLGKFLACLLLVKVALILTLPLPITVSFLGDLDWGPVIAGYIATFFLAGAYTSIGLFISSRSDNQIVSLLLTVVTCSVLYLIGSPVATSLLGTNGAEIAELLGSGSRFESITRGVIDIRDLYYYLSIIGVFISLNILSLERLKWSHEISNARHKVWNAITVLTVLNLLVANIWLDRLNAGRVDVTAGSVYSISPATERYIEQLDEPLLIRGYFSEKTHPLLAPLVPQLRDLLREYEIAGQGKIRAEFVDPRDNEQIEEEASRKYGIKPVPFQIADKYQAALVNSYFDVLISYGDEYEVLSFRDLIEIKQGMESIDVRLRDPEYDITRSIKKVLYGFRSLDALFDSLDQPVVFTGYISSESKLPEQLTSFTAELKELLNEYVEMSGGKFSHEFIEPEAQGGQVASEIGEHYGFQPMMTLLSPQPFYYYMVLGSGKDAFAVPLPEELDVDGARRSIEAAFKRFSKGFVKTVGLLAPEQPMARPGMPPAGSSFSLLERKLEENYTVNPLDISSGVVPEDIDILLALSPKEYDEKRLFALDQFLMKGGTVVLATSPFSINQAGGIIANKHNSGLAEWLKHHGISIDEKFVLDPQNEPFPVPRRRDIGGGMAVEEIEMVRYPFFVQVRQDGMNQDTLITSGIPQVTLNWSSPISVTTEGTKRTMLPLLKSTESSWLTDSTTMQPDFTLYPNLGFPVLGETKQQMLAVKLEGQFESYFKDRESPLLVEEAKEAKEGEEESTEQEIVTGVINKSPQSARIIVFASNNFLADQTLSVSAALGGSQYMNSLQLVENALDWSLEDRGLLSIRSRGQFNRTLVPIERNSQIFYEAINYGAALLGLLIVFFLYRVIKRGTETRYEKLLAGGQV